MKSVKMFCFLYATLLFSVLVGPEDAPPEPPPVLDRPPAYAAAVVPDTADVAARHSVHLLLAEVGAAASAAP